MAAGSATIVDTRTDRAAFMAGHLAGSIHAPLDKTLPTIVGSYADPEADVVLVIDEDDVDTAVRELVRIGFDRVRAFVLPADVEAADGLASIPTTTFAAYDEIVPAGAVVLDVRGASEFAAGHVEGARNIAHTRLGARLDEIPQDTPLAVHCRTGARAAAAVSFLAARGYPVTLVDDEYARCALEQVPAAEAVPAVDSEASVTPAAGA